MTDSREQEVRQALQGIVDAFEPTKDEPELTMFGLISRYNKHHGNPEMIGGAWARERGFDLP